MLRFIFGRYLAYGFIFIEILVVPELLTPNKYANFEYLKSLVALSSLVLLGSHTGYIYYNYTKRRNYFDSLLKVAFFSASDSRFGGWVSSKLIDSFYTNCQYGAQRNFREKATNFKAVLFSYSI